MYKSLFILLLTLPFAIQQELFEELVELLNAEVTQIILEPPDTPPDELLKEYDFIVVGAGTAGCVLANRLTENPDWSVLLIEAGKPENFIMDIPIFANYLQFTESNWKYRTEPDGRSCLGFDDERCNWPRGKVVGGSSVLNYMIYTRGNKQDFDHWADLGNTGWGYEDILPYFRKIENFTVPGVHDRRYHGYDGYLGVSYAPHHTKIAASFVNACMEYGFPYVDYDGEKQVGVSFLHASLKDGVRSSSSRAYLHSISSRLNLHMSKDTMVTKIIIDKSSKEVQGVRMVKDGRTYTVRARKEVISSAGAINSPQLLMLSGIGPKKHLKEVGIKVLSDLKVGYNLMDHIAMGGFTFLVDEPISLMSLRILLHPQYTAEYMDEHKGPLSVPGGSEAILFTDLDHPGDPDGWPDLELLSLGGSINSDLLTRKNFGITDENYDAVYKPIEMEDAFMIFPMLLRPKSKGRIKLKNKNYKTKPYLFANYFDDPKDMETMIKGVRLILNITAQPALQAIGTRLHDIPIPKCADNPFASDAYFECMARHFTFTIYHQSGTCKMGPATDKTAVVDPRLRVYGIKGLRVIDVSIMPEIPAAHTNAPTYLVAEKGADMIKQDWGYPITFK